MIKFDRKEQLKKLHEERKSRTHTKIEQAIERLLKVHKPINFNSVAKESGVTKSTLYNNKKIREKIEKLRDEESKVPTPSQVKREMDDNNKDAIIASLKRKIKKLEDENRELREQVKINYGEIYNKI